jgi:hypothetical protein
MLGHLAVVGPDGTALASTRMKTPRYTLLPVLHDMRNLRGLGKLIRPSTGSSVHEAGQPMCVRWWRMRQKSHDFPNAVNKR